MSFKVKTIGALLALSSAFGLHAADIILHTPSNFNIMSLSPNGQWACGVFLDASNETYAFRWNLNSGSIELISAGVSMAWDVANDGTVSGEFRDTQALPNGTPVAMPGYYRDGKWHNVEMPDGNVTDGIGGGISPDGHHITGSIEVNGIYTPYIWTDGALVRSLATGDQAVAYAVSPDGLSAAGFTTTKNRTACIWPPESDVVLFTDSPESSYSPWNYSRNFSPDGKKLVYWGGWDYDQEAEKLYLYSIYDVETGERIKIECPSVECELEFYDISNNGMLVGCDGNIGAVYAEGKVSTITQYLKDKGVSLDSFNDFYVSDFYENDYPIYCVVAVSEDEKTFALRYYNTSGQVASMVLKTDYNASNDAPAEVNVRQLEGLNIVELSWKAPFGATAIKGYNIYRDGKKINGFLPVNALQYYDKNLENGTYEYTVATVNTSGKEIKSETFTVNVADSNLPAPYSVFARQKGVNSAHVSWMAPASPMIHKRYFDLGITDLTGFSVYGGYTVELGVRYDKKEMTHYANNYSVKEVSFYPMGDHFDWTINFYTYTDGILELLSSQPINQKLRFKELNTVTLDTPVAVPDGDLIVAIEAAVNPVTTFVIGVESGKATPQYSDLLRLKGEEDFYSAYESSLESGMWLSAISWAIDLGIAADNDEDATTLSHYNVYVNGEIAAQTTDNNIVLPALENGDYDIDVEAVYSNGVASEQASASVNITNQYKAINDVKMEFKEVASQFTASWEAPVDDDAHDVTYSTDAKHSTGIQGNESNDYNIWAASEYPATMFRGYDGYRVESFRFYPLCKASFTFMLFENEEQVCVLEAKDYTPGKWNEVKLPANKKVIINENSTYRLIIDCFQPEPDTRVLAIDNDVPRPYQSDLYTTTDGYTWNSLTVEAGTRGNWMMGIRLADVNCNPIDVVGYDVVIDGKKRNEETIEDTSFFYDLINVDSKRHTVQVNTYYETAPEVVNGTVNNFYFPTNSIGDAIASIDLRQGENYLCAEGEGVESITVFSTSGIAAACARGNKVDISALASGYYIVRINVAGKTITHKVKINR